MFIICFFVDFNSIKVRLKRPADWRNVERHQFQFHKGTIKTVYTLLYIEKIKISIP